MEIRQDRADDGVVTLTLDDGAKNTWTPAAFQALIDAFDGLGDARAVVLAGNGEIFSAGLDVKFMASAGREAMRDLLVLFGRALTKVWVHPTPTVCAATGHAVAAGTMMAMACDHAVASESGWWGLIETQIDFEMPDFGTILSRHNVRSDRLEDLILPGARVDAATAVEVGFADELAPLDEVVARAQTRAAELAALPPRAYAGTKRRLRQADAEAILAGLDADIDALTSHL